MNDDEFFDSVAKSIDTKFDKFREDLRQWYGDVFNMVNFLATEVKDNREFRKFITDQANQNRKRIRKLEKKVFGVVAS